MMPKITCVTSMNKPYYDRIGKLMIETFSKFWPDNSNLCVYQEGFQIEKFDRVIGLSWEDNCLSDWKEFSTKIHGPAITFAKKGFSFISGMKNLDADYLLWLDADLVSLKKFPSEKIISILPEGKLIGFFDTYFQLNPNYTEKEYIDKNRPLTAAESGFVILNKKHKKYKDYVSEYERLYRLPENPNTLGDWFDGNICSAAALNLREHVEDLSKLRTTDKSQTPINRSWIFEYCYHAKAKQKDGLDIKKLRAKLGV